MKTVSFRWPGTGRVMVTAALGLAAFFGPQAASIGPGGVAWAQNQYPPAPYPNQYQPPPPSQYQGPPPAPYQEQPPAQYEDQPQGQYQDQDQGQGADIDIDAFHSALDPYGQWVDTPQYGQVWSPTSVQPGWRPYYNDGHWVYSDENGWTWVSDLPWGWAPFHYGRWAEDPQYGWIWVPGRVWGPAWVTFRSSDDAIGWAPLPPDDGWDPSYGYQGGNGLNVNIGVDLWNFVRPEGFLEPRFDRYAYDRRDYPRIVDRTRNITNITVINNRIVNNSIDVTNIERVTHRKVEHVTLANSDRPGKTEVNGNKVVLYKPAVIGYGKNLPQANAATLKEDPGRDNKKRKVVAGAKPGTPVAPPPPKNPGTESTSKQQIEPSKTVNKPPSNGAQPEVIQKQAGKEKKKKMPQQENGTAKRAAPNQVYGQQQQLKHKETQQPQEQQQPGRQKEQQKCKGDQCPPSN